MKNSEIYKVIFDTSPDAIIVSNTIGEILFVNNQVEKMFGYVEHELIGQKIHFLIPDRFHHKHIENHDSFVSNSSKRVMGLGEILSA